MIFSPFKSIHKQFPLIETKPFFFIAGMSRFRVVALGEKHRFCVSFARSWHLSVFVCCPSSNDSFTFPQSIDKNSFSFLASLIIYRFCLWLAWKISWLWISLKLALSFSDYNNNYIGKFFQCFSYKFWKFMRAVVHKLSEDC